MRTHPCVRLVGEVDTLTNASVLPGVEASIRKPAPACVARNRASVDVMSASAQKPALAQRWRALIANTRVRPGAGSKNPPLVEFTITEPA